MRFEYSERDYLDIVDFITSTLELQEDTRKANKEVEEEIQESLLKSLQSLTNIIGLDFADRLCDTDRQIRESKKTFNTLLQTS